MRVFQGFNNQAGQPSALARALREIGVVAESHCTTINKYAYQADRHVNPVDLENKEFFVKYFNELIANFDIFHFHASTFFANELNKFPTLQDVILLKLAGKKVVFHFRGSEARLESVNREKNPFHFFDLQDFHVDLLKFGQTEVLQRQFIAAVCEIADLVYAVDPEIQNYVPKAKIIPRVLEIQNEEQPLSYLQNKIPLVVHAPSKRGLKGTQHVISAVQKLREKGLQFDFQLIENLPNAEAKKLYQRADIVIDQLRIGWYGVLAVETMAMGKVVLSYIREDLLPFLGKEKPIVAVTIDNLSLKLEELLLNNDLREQIGKRAEQYFRETHESKNVARMLVEDYQKMMLTNTSEGKDFAALVNLFAHQYCSFMNDKKRPLNALINSVTRLKRLLSKVSLGTALKLLVQKISQQIVRS